jgi:hypothetical protein
VSGNRSQLKKTAFRRLLAQFATVAALLLFCSIIRAQKITVNFNHNFDFSTKRNYAWRGNYILTRQGWQNDERLNVQIMVAVDRMLAGKGFVKDSARPDFFVSYEAGSASSSVGFEGPHSGPTPHMNEPPSQVHGMARTAGYSVTSQITFHVVDAKSNQPVWSATAKEKIRDPQKAMKDAEKWADKIVSKTFKSFPPHAP